MWLWGVLCEEGWYRRSRSLLAVSKQRKSKVPTIGMFSLLAIRCHLFPFSPMVSAIFVSMVEIGA